MTQMAPDPEPGTPDRPRRWLVAGVAAALGLAAVWSLGAGPSRSVRAGSSPAASPPPGSTASFVVATTTGAGFAVPTGKPTILLFMTTQGCTDCATQAQALDQVAQTSSGSIAVLGLEVDPSVRRSDLDSFSRMLGGLHYPLAIDRRGILQQRFQAEALSTVVILNAAGHLVWRSVDPTSADLQAGLRHATT